MKIVTKVVLFSLLQVGVFLFIFLFAVVQQKKILFELEQILQRDIELSNSLSQLSVYQLEFSVHIERYVKQVLEQNYTPKEETIRLPIPSQIKQDSPRVDQLIDGVDEKIQDGVRSNLDPVSDKQYLRLQTEFGKIKMLYAQYDEMSRMILSLVSRGHLGDLQVFEKSFATLEDNLNCSIEMLLEEIQEYTSIAAQNIRAREKKILNIYIAAGIVLLVSGIMFLTILARRIHSSISSVVTLAERIEGGERDIDVNIMGSDEIARITRAMGYMLNAIAEAESELRKLAMTDTLTGVANRLKFNTVLSEEIRRVERYATPLSLIIFDIDHFKFFNDTYGHDEGDRILQGLAELAEKHIRSTDLLARWGGEEFVVLTPGTGLNSGAVLAEKLRVKIEQHDFGNGRKVTSSFGVAGFSEENMDDFLKGADEALYHSKKEGRNRVSIWQNGKAEKFI